MPYTMTTTKTASVGSDSFVQRFSDTGENQIQSSPSIPAAKVGELTTRTDNDTGVCTMVTGHGFATSDKIDLFWDGGSRRNMTATVAGDAVTLDGGTGDNLPVLNTDITAMKPVDVAMAFTGNNAVGIAVYSPVSAFIVICVNTTTLTAPYQLDAGEGKSWSYSSGETNPVSGVSITLVKFSHGSTSAQDLKAAVILDV